MSVNTYNNVKEMLEIFRHEDFLEVLKECNIKLSTESEHLVRERVFQLAEGLKEDVTFHGIVWRNYNFTKLKNCQAAKELDEETAYRMLKSTKETIRYQMITILLTKPRKAIDETLELITNNFKEDEACLEERNKNYVLVSFECVLGKVRIVAPARGTQCDHLQCFDAETFLVILENTKKTIMPCPICGALISSADVILDAFFELLLSTMRPEGSNVLAIYPDCGFVQLNNETEFAAPVPEADSDEDVVVIGEVKRSLASSTTSTRGARRQPLSETSVAPEDMLQIIEIND